MGANVALLNTAALRKLGVHNDQPSPEGGVFARNPADGKLTGMTFQFARFQIGRHYSELATDQDATQELNGFFENAVRFQAQNLKPMVANSQ